MSHLVFVYGSLKRGQHNHRLLAKSAYISTATTTGRWRMLDGGYPVVLPERHKAGAGKIRGELYVINDQTFAELDRLESYGVLYTRCEVPVITDGGAIHQAWMYVGLRLASWFHSQSFIPRINGCLEWPRQNNTL